MKPVSMREGRNGVDDTGFVQIKVVTEIWSHLTDAEFKTLLIKMLNELRRSVGEFSENFNKEIQNIKMKMEIIKGKQSEMRNTLSETKSILDGINRMEKEEY